MADAEEREAERAATTGSYEDVQRAMRIVCRRKGHDVGIATASRAAKDTLRRATVRFCWRCSVPLDAFIRDAGALNFRPRRLEPLKPRSWVEPRQALNYPR